MELPPPTPFVKRILKHPGVMPYHRLTGLVVAANLVLVWYGLVGGRWWTGQGIDLTAVATVTQANFALAIVVRQQFVVNALFWLATRAPTTWPLRLRWALAKVYHFGGLHVGAATSGTAWSLVFVVLLSYEAAHGRGHVTIANLVLSGAFVMLVMVMALLALPPLRARAHDRFETMHRFGGWAALVLAWANTVLFVCAQRDAAGLLTAPTVWLLVVSTVSVALPWLLLRRVPITVERPSNHVALVSLQHWIRPAIGSTRPFSRHPLLDWHSFANIAPVRSRRGYRVIVSRAGDWTGAFNDNPPTHLWVRGIPTAGMANVQSLFRKVVFVATGSGIGPVLAHLLADEGPSHLLWVTRDPRRTYGDALVDEILRAQPDATIWNTDEHGKPDMLRLAYGVYAACGAEAVICIANKTVTWQVVHGLERLGIPACGPIWDS